MRRRVVLMTMFGLVVAGCASSPRTASGGTAPTMLSTTRPDMRLPPGRTTGVTLDLQIAVRVDSTGRPIMESLEVSGVGATDNREIVAEWIRAARFQPARQAGQAVEGVFRTRIQARSEVRRFGARAGDAMPWGSRRESCGPHTLCAV